MGRDVAEWSREICDWASIWPRAHHEEQWLHALLFVNHPLVLISTGWLWAHLTQMIQRQNLHVKKMHGFNPVCDGAFWKTLLTRRISEQFRFRLGKSLQCGYLVHGHKKLSML